MLGVPPLTGLRQTESSSSAPDRPRGEAAAAPLWRQGASLRGGGGVGVPAVTGAVAEDEVRCSEERLGTRRRVSI